MRSHCPLSIFHCPFSIVLALALTMSSCSSSENEEEGFPALITEMGLLRVGASTADVTLLTDGGHAYRVSTEIEGLKPNALARCLCGYVLQDEGTVEVRTLSGVGILPDCTELDVPYRDPVGAVSAWMGGGFVNLHLLKKTQGADHQWGFLLDDQHPNVAGGTTYEVSLFHRQGDDPAAYSTDIYFSLSQDSLSRTRTTADSLLLTVHTFEAQPHRWRFGLTP
ncbi:MAG: hypothetical protein IJ700_08880 [Bacteroidaceae bacterium]|nr:hypothetical protein [Bacteroidaceae bacterium]MBR1683445.1 hypothetical protein [Bacteroidaceae bacterium]